MKISEFTALVWAAIKAKLDIFANYKDLAVFAPTSRYCQTSLAWTEMALYHGSFELSLEFQDDGLGVFVLFHLQKVAPWQPYFSLDQINMSNLSRGSPKDHLWQIFPNQPISSWQYLFLWSSEDKRLFFNFSPMPAGFLAEMCVFHFLQSHYRINL